MQEYPVERNQSSSEQDPVKEMEWEVERLFDAIEYLSIPGISYPPQDTFIKKFSDQKKLKHRKYLEKRMFQGHFYRIPENEDIQKLLIEYQHLLEERVRASTSEEFFKITRRTTKVREMLRVIRLKKELDDRAELIAKLKMDLLLYDYFPIEIADQILVALGEYEELICEFDENPYVVHQEI